MSDDDLLAELATVLDRLDPVPGSVRAAAIAAGAFLGASWDCLELVPMAGVAVRGEARMWRSSAGIIEVSDRVSGLVTIPVKRVELHSRNGIVDLPLDAAGGFSAHLPPGRLRLVLHRDSLPPLVSEWFN